MLVLANQIQTLLHQFAVVNVHSGCWKRSIGETEDEGDVLSSKKQPNSSNTSAKEGTDTINETTDDAEDSDSYRQGGLC